MAFIHYKSALKKSIFVVFKEKQFKEKQFKEKAVFMHRNPIIWCEEGIP